MWEELTLDEIVKFITDNDKKTVFILSGFSYLFNHNLHLDIFISDGIINTKYYQRLINLIVETYKSLGHLIRKKSDILNNTIKFLIYV